MDEPQLIPAFAQVDRRGRLMEVAEWDAEGPVNVKMSVSKAGTLRGLHFQAAPFAQAKIIRVCSGSIVDVAVSLVTGDLYEARLASADPYSLHIPVGFAHGFMAEVDDTSVVYLSMHRYNADSERAFNPLLLGYRTFDWGRPEGQMIVSAKDRNAPPLPLARGARHFRSVNGVWALVGEA